MTTAMMMAAAGCAAGCAAKCPPHAIAAVAGAFVAGLVVGRLWPRRKRGACACGERRTGGGKPPRREPRSSGETHAPIPAGSVEIYVGNLSYDLNDEQLRKEFEAFGTVSTARVVANRFNGKSKGFGFVVMPNRAEAEAAIAAINEKEVLGRRMRVNEAKNTVVQEAPVAEPAAPAAPAQEA